MTTATPPATSATSANGRGLSARVIRPSLVAAVVGLAKGIILRLFREGLVVRALAWPGLLTALSLFLSAALSTGWKSSNVIVVTETELVAPLESGGFQVMVAPDAEAQLRRGATERAVWREGDRLVLGSNWNNALTAQAEAVLRDVTSERWRLVVPAQSAPVRRTEEQKRTTGLLAGIVVLLFVLYGVVIGAGSLYRDRSSGVMESDLALAVPRWVHSVARLAALSLVLMGALVVSLLIVDTLLAIHELGAWLFDGLVAVVAAGGLGMALMGRADDSKGFSGPLSQALTLSMALISLGYWRADLGCHLPLVSLGSAFAGVHSSWTVFPIVVLASAALAADFHRRETL